jgi:hypothetical protein
MMAPDGGSIFLERYHALLVFYFRSTNCFGLITPFMKLGMTYEAHGRFCIK